MCSTVSFRINIPGTHPAGRRASVLRARVTWPLWQWAGQGHSEAPNNSELSLKMLMTTEQTAHPLFLHWRPAFWKPVWRQAAPLPSPVAHAVGWAIFESGSASSRRWCWQSPRACSKPAQKDRWHVDLWWSRAISLETLAAWLDWPISIGSLTSCYDSCTLLKIPNPPGVSRLSSHSSCASCIFPSFRVIWVIRVAHFAFFVWVHYLTETGEREYTRLFSACYLDCKSICHWDMICRIIAIIWFILSA